MVGGLPSVVFQDSSARVEHQGKSFKTCLKGLLLTLKGTFLKDFNELSSGRILRAYVKGLS